MKQNKTPTPQLRETDVSGSRFVPMLFSTPMITAILNGTKTETRRTINVDKTLDFMGFRNNYKKLEGHAFFGDMYNFEIKETIKPKVKADDIIWVRETFFAWGKWVKNGISKTGKQKYIFIDLTLKKVNRKYHYVIDDVFDKKLLRKNNNSEKENIEGWYKRNSLFMPKSAARIFLKVVSVSVERLQDIDEKSAINEGVEFSTEFGYKLYSKNSFFSKHLSASDSYMSLWESINGQGSWKENPFVWVYKFQRIDEPHGFH